MSIVDQTFVVVGGTSGIGLATARAAIGQGAKVVVIGRDEARLANALEELGPGAKGEPADAGDRPAIDAALARVGPFDHLIVAASGGGGAGAFATLKPHDLRAGFEAKFWVQWHCAQAALPYLSNAGSITFVTAASSRVANPGTSGLAAVNGAVAAMVLPLAHELAPRRVNAVSPGVIDTPWWDAQPRQMRDAYFGKVEATLPAGRVGRPEEIAQGVLLLTQNAYITGVILDIDGGMRSSPPN